MITKNVLQESEKGIDFSDFWNDTLVRPAPTDADPAVVVGCNIPQLDTHKHMLVNGFGDGTCINVPAHSDAPKPIQIQSVVAMDRKALVELNYQISVGEDSRVQIIHCDDTVGNLRSLSSNTTQLVVGEGASVEYYKLQNINNQSGVINRMTVVMKPHSSLKMVCLSLNGGHICNHIEVRMQGEGCQLQADGLYLLDRDQQCDNYIFVDHAHPHCTSRELYKGILDDQARARFNGHVLVRDGACKTEAYQSNKNIILNDKAHMDTRPFLEIYNDDVKCSHGSTVGQLDEQALFYLQTRGISHRTATMMLSYAFCDEVIRNIGIDPLRSAIEDMVKRRLHGELNSCADCALQCGGPCNTERRFTIDPTQL